MSEDLYEMYKKKISEMLAMVEKALQTKTGSTNSFLIEYVDQWRKFTFFTNTIRIFFHYLEKCYMKNQGDQSLTKTALTMYRDKIFQKHLGRLRSAILVEIKKDREGEMVDHGLVKKAIMQFIYVGYEQKVNIAKVKESNEFDWIGERSLRVYDEEFEAPLKAATAVFFRENSLQWRRTMTCHEYVTKVHKHFR